MADEKLSWQLQFDLVGNGLQEARSQMESMQRSLSKGQKAMVEFEIAGKKVQVEIQGIGEKAEKAVPKLDKMRDSLKEFAKTNWAAIGAVTALGGALAYGFSKLDQFGDMALKAFGERQGALRAYRTLFGSESKAEEEFGKAGAFAARTDLTFEDTLRAQKKLAVAGFRNEGKDNALDRALLTVSDVASMASPEDRGLAMERLGKAFADVKSKGKLQGEELKQLSEGGLSRRLIVEEVGKLLKIKGGNAAVEKLISGGGVTDDIGIAAIQRAALSQFGTSKLGQYSVGAAGSLSGLLSNRDEQFQNQMRAIDSEALPSVKEYKLALTEQSKAFDLATQKGQNLSITLQGFADTSIGLKSVWTDFVTGLVESFAESYAEAARAMGIGKDGMTDLSANARAMGAELGKVGDAVFQITHAFETLAPVVEVVSGTLNLLWKTFTTIIMSAADLVWSLIPFAEKLTGRSNTDAFLSAGKRINELGAAALNGGFDPGQSPRELAEKRRQEREAQDAKDRVKEVKGATFKEEAKKKAEAASGKGSGGGGGGIGEIFAVAGLRGIIEKDLMAGAVSVPLVPGLRGMVTPQIAYQQDLNRELTAGMAERKPVPAVVKIDDVEIVVTGDMSPGDVAAKIAEVLQSYGRYARTPAPGNT